MSIFIAIKHYKTIILQNLQPEIPHAQNFLQTHLSAIVTAIYCFTLMLLVKKTNYFLTSGISLVPAILMHSNFDNTKTATFATIAFTLLTNLAAFVLHKTYNFSNAACIAMLYSLALIVIGIWNRKSYV